MRSTFIGRMPSSSWHSRLRIPESSLLNWIRLAPLPTHHTGRTRSISSSATLSSPAPWEIPSVNKKGIRYIRPRTNGRNFQRKKYSQDKPSHEPVERIRALPSQKWDSAQAKQDYADRFYELLASGQPNIVLALLTDPRSKELVGSLPQTTFIEALHLLSPAHFVEPFRNLHHPLHSWSTFLHGVKRAEEIFDDFVRSLYTIAGYRVAADNVLGLAEYTHLLDCARSMGNAPLAEDLWLSMQKDEVEPDGTCYNHYIGAKVWDHCFVGQEAYNLRMLPRAYKKRRMRERNVGWRGYATGKLSIRRTTLEIFREMRKAGYLPDQRTYINLMIASARTGHMRAVYHLLKTVWNIDVEGLKETTDHSTQPPATAYEPWSALHPTKELLFAVVHAFGTNSDISGAVSTIQFISTSYNIPIPPEVWHELFERAYVLSRTREPAETREYENTVGKISSELVELIFQIMTSEPYNIAPNLQTLRFMMRIAIDKGSFKESRLYLQAGYDLLASTRRHENDARAIIMALLRAEQPDLDETNPDLVQDVGYAKKASLLSPQLYDAISKYNLIRLEIYQQSHLLKRAIISFVGQVKWEDRSEKLWLFQLRPRIIEEWRDFLPDHFQMKFGSDEGIIHFRGKTSHQNPDYCLDGRIAVQRLAGNGILYNHLEFRSQTEESIWNDVKDRFPWLDDSAEPVKSLLNFQAPRDQEFKRVLRKLRRTWVVYPEGHQWSTGKNPMAGFYGRLAALGMLKPKQRGVFYLDNLSWI
ncbi:hypothetical protein N7540_001295 [Penicillium herquei]|nr:hypothetical protein N7540_001295 [Penicillium herquei]